jgi:hypothetical protein
MKTLALIAALCLPSGFFAYLNSPLTEQSLSGWTSEGHLISNHLSSALARSPADKRSRLTSHTNPQDRAVALILSGDYAKGIDLLNQIESSSPGDYNTAANLGTAFELHGRSGLQRAQLPA